MERALVTSIFWSLVGLICLYLMIPSFVVIPMSFNSSELLQFPPESFSLKWYERYFSRDEWTTSTLNSFIVAGLTTVVATILGTMMALGLIRGQVPFRNFWIGVLLTPLIIPTIVSAVALYRVLGPVRLVGSIPGLVLAHTVLALPFVLVNVSAVLQRVDWTVEQAARSLGASPLQAFLLVTLPIIRPGILAGALFAFITSFDEVVIALFISGVGAVTLPVQMWSGLRFEINPVVASASTLLIGLSIVVLALAAILRRRSEL